MLCKVREKKDGSKPRWSRDAIAVMRLNLVS